MSPPHVPPSRGLKGERNPMRGVGATQRLGQLPRCVQPIAGQHFAVHAGQPAAGQRVQELPVVGAQRERLHDAGMEEHGRAEAVQNDVEVGHVRHVATAFGHRVAELQRFPGGVQSDGRVRVGGERATGGQGGGYGVRRPVGVGGVAQTARGGLKEKRFFFFFFSSRPRERERWELTYPIDPGESAEEDAQPHGVPVRQHRQQMAATATPRVLRLEHTLERHLDAETDTEQAQSTVQTVVRTAVPMRTRPMARQRLQTPQPHAVRLDRLQDQRQRDTASSCRSRKWVWLRLLRLHAQWPPDIPFAFAHHKAQHIEYRVAPLRLPALLPLTHPHHPIVVPHPVDHQHGRRTRPEQQTTASGHRSHPAAHHRHIEQRLGRHVRRVDGQHAASRRPLNEDGGQRGQPGGHEAERVEIEAARVPPDDAQPHAVGEGVRRQEGGGLADGEQGAPDVLGGRQASAHGQRELVGREYIR